MPQQASLFTKEKTAFVGLGWSNIATPQTTEEEKAFLSTLLQELKREFALQLDISSRTFIVRGGGEPRQQAGNLDRIHLP